MNLIKLEIHLCNWAFFYILFISIGSLFFIHEDYYSFPVIVVALVFLALIKIVRYLRDRED